MRGGRGSEMVGGGVQWGGGKVLVRVVTIYVAKRSRL